MYLDIHQWSHVYGRPSTAHGLSRRAKDDSIQQPMFQSPNKNFAQHIKVKKKKGDDHDTDIAFMYLS